MEATPAVDPLRDHGSGPRGHRRWCHLMVAHDADLEELHAFAARLGLRREWFQDQPRFPHYDLTTAKRALAVRLGALEVSARQQLWLCMRGEPGDRFRKDFPEYAVTPTASVQDGER